MVATKKRFLARAAFDLGKRMGGKVRPTVALAGARQSPNARDLSALRSRAINPGHGAK